MAETTVELERRPAHARYSPILRDRALATRAAILDALEDALDSTPWHRISVAGLVRAAGRCGQTAFYQYFADLESAFEALMGRVAEQGREPSEHMRLIAALLEFEQKRVHRD